MKNLENYVDTLIADKAVQNIFIRVGRGDEIIRDVCRSSSASINADTLFDVASLTKIVATLPLFLIAIDKGLVGLDEKVSKFFSLKGEKEELTLRHLITHTMGIGHKSLRLPEVTYENVGDHILSIPCDIPIGSDVLYSCPAYILTGKILEKIFGEPLDVLFNRLIKVPLSMTSAGFHPQSVINAVNSNPNVSELGVVNDYNCRHLGGVAGNAGLFASVNDLTAYVRCIINGGSPLISREMLDLATTNQTPTAHESRGLGFVYVDEKYSQTGDLFPHGSIGHCGHTGQSLFINRKSGVYVIILSDATLSNVKKYGHENYSEVIKMRRNIHNAIKRDLKA